MHPATSRPCRWPPRARRRCRSRSRRDRWSRRDDPGETDRGCDGDQHADDLVDRRPRRERHGGVPLVRGRSGIEGNERAQAHERMRLRVQAARIESSSCSERTFSMNRSSLRAIHRSASSCLATASRPSGSARRTNRHATHSTRFAGGGHRPDRMKALGRYVSRRRSSRAACTASDREETPNLR